MGSTPLPTKKQPQQKPPNPISSSSSSSFLHYRRRVCKPQFLSPKSKIEVQTDEEGFTGVYFEATVIKSPEKETEILGKIYVEYQSLLAQEEGSERLTEYVDVSFVRPEPPQELCKGFEQNDVVDAYYKDGWWTGVVTSVVERGERFIVTFQDPPDELEFGLAELRVHWDWVNGSWIRPQKKSVAAAVMFDVGLKVEVSLDAKDCRDAWFPATIQEDLRNGAFLAEYSKADGGNKEAQRLKITVDSLHVRPNPPLLKEKTFDLLEKVDAYFDFAWWSGVITKKLEGSNYVVFFKQMKRDKEFHQSELRPHLQWKDGKWFISSQDSLMSPSEDVMPEHSSGNTVAVPVNNVDNEKDLSEQSTPATQKSSQVTTSLTKRIRHFSHSRDVNLQPHKKQKEGNMHRASQQDTHDKSIKEMLPGSYPVPVNNMTGSATQTATGDQSDNPSWGKRIQRKQRKVGTARSDSEKVYSASSSLKKGSTQILHDKSPEADIGGKEPNAVGNIAEDVEDVQNKLMNIETKDSVVLGLPCTEKGSSEFGISGEKRGRPSNGKGTMKRVSDQKLQLHDSSIQGLKDSKLSETGEVSAKRKRGRPRKSLIENLATPIIGNAQNGIVASDDLSRIDSDAQKTPEVTVIGTDASLPNKKKTGLDELKDEQANSQSGHENQKGSTTKQTLANKHGGKVVKESIKLLQQRRAAGKGKRRAAGRGKRRPAGRGKRQNTDSSDASGRKTIRANCIGEVVEVDPEAPCNEFDNEPLSKWIEGMHPPSIVDGSKTSPVNNIEECMGNNQTPERGVLVPENGNEKLPETEEQTSGSIDRVSVDPSDQQNLPFVKNNMLWKMIDSMDVFQRIPQRPHFQPLEHCKESSREGLAIGYMVNFCTMVEKVSGLQFNDAKSITDDDLETLADLESHGFDVSVLRERATRLVALKDKQGKLVDDVNEFKSQILEHNREKSRIEEEINDINQQIQKLQEKLLLSESTKKEEDVEITNLEAKLQEAEENLKNVEQEFVGTALL